ncbi:membrane protein insertase YidC [Actinoplanes sp. NPDC049599]|uniref:membrane protein insertase YidC n=1 Tax=Actinoplanes sp. NPDC049599 TaxID=3363903 RepID=UPI0037B078A7
MSISAALDAVVGVAHSALEGLATLLTPAAGGLSAALAVIGFTIAVRLLISPLSWLQARSARRGAALAPQLAALRERHRDDPVLLATETLALQRANGAGPGAALLPALAQAPFFMLMYGLVQPGSGTPTGVLAGHLFGVPLAAHLAAGLPVFAVLLVLATGLAWWSSRRARRLLPAGGGPVRWLLGVVPFLTVVMVAWLPLAGGLYLVTSAAWTALEQVIWRRPTAGANR